MDLSDEEIRVFEGWSVNQKRLRAREALIREGDRTEQTCLVLDGWLSRHKDLRTGARQIVGLMLPGDLCDLHSFILKRADHGIWAISGATVALTPSEQIADDLANHPRLGRALWWSSLVETALAREWIVNIARRSAIEAIAHLFAELWVRCRLVGLIGRDGLALPLTQVELGQALGLSSIHVSRSLKALREMDLAIFAERFLTIPDEGRLLAFARFDPNYLQLERRQD